jgi:phytoene/squalene synthetase
LEQLKIVNERNSSLFHDLIDARRETLGDRAFVSVKKLEENSRSVYGTLIRLLALELTNDKSESEELRQAANNLGTAVGVATLLRCVFSYFKLIPF